MNINKLFPRLTIRAKLAIAFASLTILPLLAVAGFSTIITSGYVRALTQTTLRHDLEGAKAQTEGSLHEVERQLAYLARAVLGPILVRPDSEAWQAAHGNVSEIFSLSPTLFRVKVIGADGRLLFVAAVEDVGPGALDDLEAGGFYYIQRASVLEQGERLALPVELRRHTDAAADSTLSAVAILEPVWDEQGSMVGLVVGETHASVLFGGLEMGSPSLTGVTGLVAGDGLLLYHTNLKNDWGRLLASRTEADLVGDLSPEGAAAVLSGEAGTLLVGDRIVSYLPLSLPGSGIGTLMLYRIVSVSALEAPVRSLQRGFLAGGALVLAIVLGLAVLAARQFTDPIYTLRKGVRHLAGGGRPGQLRVETNDELEDLAEDFTAMAQALSEHRSRLEHLVAKRTRDLQEAHSELEDILEYSADAIAGLDVDGRVRIWNRGAETLFGYTSAEAVGRHVDELLAVDKPAAEAEAALIRRELERHGAVVNLLTKRAPKEGKPFPVTVTQAPICDNKGRTVGYSLIIRDNRLQSKLADQMRRSERYAAVSVMAAGLAHELKNPLGIIDNRIELMQEQVRETSENGDLLEDLRVVGEHTRRLVGVTRGLLAFGQDDTEERAPVDMNQMSRHVGELLERTFSARDIGFELDLAEDLPTISGNEHAIETVCVNLLLNAADATPPGGRVVLVTRRNPSELEVEVSDTGPGVPEEIRRLIFEPFFTTKRADHGTGLGLAVCRSIVDRHMGRIWAESEPGGGTRFIVSFPLDLADKQWTVPAS